MWSVGICSVENKEGYLCKRYVSTDPCPLLQVKSLYLLVLFLDLSINTKKERLT